MPCQGEGMPGCRQVSRSPGPLLWGLAVCALLYHLLGRGPRGGMSCCSSYLKWCGCQHQGWLVRCADGLPYWSLAKA